MLAGYFNEDIYRNKFCKRLAKDDLNMTEQILKTSGSKIPPTHYGDSNAICRAFEIAGVECKKTGTEVLKRGSDV